MDTELARTFLAVVAAGHFSGAAEQLHLTQSTVSARINVLERRLGARLFVRNKQGAQPTAAGRRFLRYAQSLVRTVELAVQDVGLPEGFSGGLTLSGRIALWEGFLPSWVDWMRRERPEISLRLEIGFEADIMQGLVHNTVDIGVLYTPESRPGFGVERLFEEQLVRVATETGRRWPDPDYIHVNWGPEFFSQFGTWFPDHPPPALSANIGWLAVQQLLRRPGSAYLPVRLAAPLIESGRLHRCAESPSFRIPVHVVYPQNRRDEAFLAALAGLRRLGAAVTEGAG
ncbi:LysR family transcriptional regulator [Endothiovibrio diazotrophicus]